jgi:hypothetical protein
MLAFVILVSGSAGAQKPCPLGVVSNKLACLIPQIYGTNGIQLDANGHEGHFEDSFVSTASTPLNSAIGTQSAHLPLASPSSGLTFSWDPTAKIFVQSTDSLGPVLGERAETIGKHRVFLGFSYQYFDFDALDGSGLKNLPIVFTHQDDVNNDVTNFNCTVDPALNITEFPASNTGPCGFVRDVVKTTDRIDLKVHQFTTFVTFGLTDRIDVSMAIPIENVRMGVSSDVSIVHNCCFDANGNPFFDHVFAPTSQCPDSCFHRVFSSSRNASGIGDITLRVKATAWTGERAALGLGVDVRVPTGDSLNFLGAGAAGVKPFVVWSYRARVSPHVLVGYEANGSSLIAGDIAAGTKDKLPSDLAYSAGADVWLTKRLTIAADLVGEEVFQARRVAATTFTELGACRDENCGTTPCPSGVTCLPLANPNTDDNLSQFDGSYNMTNASLGVKLKPFSNFLITANVTLKVNDGGLRAKTVPLVGLSYTF